jgi:hypothetical protein
MAKMAMSKNGRKRKAGESQKKWHGNNGIERNGISVSAWHPLAENEIENEENGGAESGVAAGRRNQR